MDTAENTTPHDDIETLLADATALFREGLDELSIRLGIIGVLLNTHTPKAGVRLIDNLRAILIKEVALIDESREGAA